MRLPFTPAHRKFKIAILSISLLIFGMTSFVTADAQNCFVNTRIKKITADISPSIKSYLEFKPVGYDANPSKRYPLLIYIGGTGEMFQQPGGTDQDLCPALQYSMPWRMNVGHFPDVVKDNDGKEYSYFVVMPFVTQWAQQYNIDPGAVIDYMLAHYRIDTNRIYLTAMSRGTDNIMGYATGSLNGAKRLAAVVPVANCFPANVGTSGYATQVSNLANGNVHVWGISCTGDIPCTETYIKNWTKSLDSLKPGYGVFTYATFACDTEGPNASHHYAWNSAYDPDYRFGPGNKNVYEWMIQYSRGGTSGPPPPPPPPPVQPNCNNITITPTTNSIKIKGLIAPVITIQIFNNSWASVYNQFFNNSPDSIATGSLPAGTYHVTVNFYSASWATICSKTQDVVVGTTAPPPPPPPPPPTGTPNCNNVTLQPGTSSLKIKGLIAPVVGVQVFNNSWASVYNQAFTNSPDSITLPSLPTGIYHVKVNFNTAAWAPICERVVDGTVGPAALIVTTDYAVDAGLDRVSTSPGRVITVSPNPFMNAVQLTINADKNENAVVSIVDLTGREVVRRSVSLQNGTNRFTLDGLSKYNPGSYILRLVTKDGVQNNRLIKQ